MMTQVYLLIGLDFPYFPSRCYFCALNDVLPTLCFLLSLACQVFILPFHPLYSLISSYDLFLCIVPLLYSSFFIPLTTHSTPQCDSTVHSPTFLVFLFLLLFLCTSFILRISMNVISIVPVQHYIKPKKSWVHHYTNSRCEHKTKPHQEPLHEMPWCIHKTRMCRFTITLLV
jgi:hypothetical protein